MCLLLVYIAVVFFFCNVTATTEIYTLSLHDALPISSRFARRLPCNGAWPGPWRDRKSTRLNSSHGYISYAVFCLKKKTNKKAVNYGRRTRLRSPHRSSQARHRELVLRRVLLLFFFKDAGTPEIYPLSLHDALPI